MTTESTTVMHSTGPIAKTPWPVREWRTSCLSSHDVNHVRRCAARVAAATPSLCEHWFRQEGVSCGWAPGPTVYLEDHRAIGLATEADARPFEYRSLGLAGDRDFVVLTEPGNAAFERYNREYVGLGSPTVLTLRELDVLRTGRLGRAALLDPTLLATLTQAARTGGGLNIVPFLSTGDVWVLAREIARSSQQPVRITAPPPRLAARTNDKLWFAALVTALFGRSALPLTMEIHGLAHAAAIIRRLAERVGQIVVKIPDSAGAAGNIVFPVGNFRGMKLADIRSTLRSHLRSVGWRGQFPLLLGEWEHQILCSPSVQVWIPPCEGGQPIIEGLFVQSVSGKKGGFLGAETAALPEPTVEVLSNEGLQLALALQQLGYYGRLSLDTVIVADGVSQRIHWIEANARWGGVSIPMTIANRIVAETANPGDLLIMHRRMRRARNVEFGDRLQALGTSLVSIPQGRRQGLLLLLPPESGFLLLCVVGLALPEARSLAHHAIDWCLDVDSGRD